MAQIFISYSRKEKRRVRSVVDALKAAGYTVFWDEGIEISAEWRSVLTHQIQSCVVFLVIWTEGSVNSEWVLRETTFALEERKKIVQIRIDPVKIPSSTAHLNAANLVGWAGNSSHPEWQKVLSSFGVDPAGRTFKETTAVFRNQFRGQVAANLNQLTDGLDQALHVAGQRELTLQIRDLIRDGYELVEAGPDYAVMVRPTRENPRLAWLLKLALYFPYLIYKQLLAASPTEIRVRILVRSKPDV